LGEMVTVSTTTSLSITLAYNVYANDNASVGQGSSQ